MANEITIKASLSYAKSGQTIISRSNPTEAGDVLDQKSADFRYVNRVQNIGASAEALGLGDVISPGMCWMKNLGTADAIEIRNGVAGANVIELEPGEWALFRAALGAVLWAISLSGTNDLEYFIVED